MALKLRKYEKIHYDSLDRKGKIAFTKARKAKMTKNLGKHAKPHDQIGKEKLDPKTVNEMRGAMSEMLKKHNFDPVEELLLYAMDENTKHTDKISVCKFLVPYITPTLKSVDIQQDLKMNVSVTLQSFQGANQMKMVQEAKLLDESEYEEFEGDEIEDGEFNDSD